VEFASLLTRCVEQPLAVFQIKAGVSVVLQTLDDACVLLPNLRSHLTGKLGWVETLPTQRVYRERSKRVVRRRVEVKRIDAAAAECLDEGDAVVMAVVADEVEVGCDECSQGLWCRNGCEGIICGMISLSSDSSSLFKRRHFDSAIIILCVRWYITYKLSYRDLKQMMAERGVDLAHTTILRWVQHYIPKFEKKWNRLARPVGSSWRVDETYIRVRGQWKYLYRAVDKQGNTVDFLLSEHRDITAAKQFFTQAIDKQGAPEKITVDGYAATHSAIVELKQSGALPINVLVRTSKYMKNLIEQDHRRVKQRVSPMLGFKKFDNAAVTIRGIELAHKIKKGKFDILGLGVDKGKDPQIWEAVLAA
jgi:transposase-like protein